MLKILNGNNLFIALIIVIVLILAVILQQNLLHYYLVNNYSDGHEKCNDKKIIWDKTIYSVDTNTSQEKYVLKVENRNKEAWFTSILPVQSASEEFKTCARGVLKFSKEMENSPTTPTEIKEQSKGLELSIGRQEPFKYIPLGYLTFNMRLHSSKFNDESYNLDAAVANIAENIFLEKKSDTSWRLSFKTFLEDKDIPFHYELVRINDQEIMPRADKIEFISSDNGKSWTQSK